MILLQSMDNPEEKEDALYELAALRAETAIASAISGFDIDLEEALALLRNTNEEGLSSEDMEKRKILVAAVNNLIEFATCEEYQMMKEAEDDDEEPEELNNKYNTRYADVENSDIEYAMAMAAIWITWDASTTITYMTQNDDRVRPWHFALHGFTARKTDFPDWMIPPIEWACRCYLIAELIPSAKLSVYGLANGSSIQKPEELDGVFKESVCKGGRIFSDEHPYFEINENDKEMLDNIILRLKEDYYG